jgi:hypothetical protein
MRLWREVTWPACYRIQETAMKFDPAENLKNGGRRTWASVKTKRCTDPCCHPLGTLSHRVERGKNWNHTFLTRNDKLDATCAKLRTRTSKSFRYTQKKTWNKTRNDAEELKQCNQNWLLHLKENIGIFSEKRFFEDIIRNIGPWMQLEDSAQNFKSSLSKKPAATDPGGGA